jgi:hypothetical protein
MPLPMTLEDVRLIEDGLWEARLRRNDFRVLHAPSKTYGDVSALVVNDPSVRFRAHSRRITSDLIRARLVNRGDTDRAIIVRGCQVRRETVARNRHTADRGMFRTRGDKRFLRALRALPLEVRELGKELLAEIRAEFGGGLKYHPESKTFVQTPDNFWAVRIQPQDQSLRIVVRGEPEYFGPVTGISLAPDRASYSSFKIWK